MRRQKSTQDRCNHNRKRQNPDKTPDSLDKENVKHRKTGTELLRKTENKLLTTITKQPSAHNKSVIFDGRRIINPYNAEKLGLVYYHIGFGKSKCEYK